MPAQTVTLPASVADDSVERMIELYEKQWEWVARSDSHPVIIDGVLNYVITITYGNLV